MNNKKTKEFINNLYRAIANLHDKQAPISLPFKPGASCCFAGVCVNVGNGSEDKTKCEAKGGTFYYKNCSDECFPVSGHCTGASANDIVLPCMTMGEGGEEQCVNLGGTWHPGPCPPGV